MSMERKMLEIPEESKTLLGLIAAGAFIGVGKLLVSGDELSFRMIVGRAILGSATSLIAGVVLIQIPNIPQLALLGIGSALGIVGQQYVEKFLRAKVDKMEQALKEKVAELAKAAEDTDGAAKP